MTDAERAYDTTTAFGSALRMSSNFTACVLQALVLKNVLTPEEAAMLVDEAKSAALRSSAATEAQKQIAGATFDQIRELLSP